ncbi:MAG: histidine phosphatase family protein [Deltaproteobacteria bacterium]|nr:histidine phosphatase family protein [Deltaproteobacteria bacterium]
MDYTRLYLVRHGQVIGHDEFRYNGQTDVDLTPLGKAQLEAMAEDLSQNNLSAIYCSDLKRTIYGAHLLARAKGLEHRVESEFKELCFGEWEGLSPSEIEERYPGELTARFRNIVDHQIPGGETIRDLWQRVGRRLRRLLADHIGENVALIAHSGVNRVILSQALGADIELIRRLDQNYGCLNIIDYFPDGTAMLRLMNGPNRITNGLLHP